MVNFLKNIYLNCSRANSGSKGTAEKVEIRIRHIKELCSKVNLFIAPSLFLRKKFIEFGIPQEKIKFAPHGVDVKSFAGLKKKSSGGRIRFGFIGTILPAKGVDILIRAFNMINNKQAELKIYGKVFSYKGFEYYPGYLRRLIKNRNIRFMGEFNYKDAPRVFSEIDILVLPSIWNENCPLTILEAFAAQTPVIASRIAGISELIKDRENGLLFEPVDSGDLYEKIKLILEEPDLLERLTAGVDRPKSIDDNAKEIEALYRNFGSQSNPELAFHRQ